MTWTAPAYPRVDEPFNGTERATSDGLPGWYRSPGATASGPRDRGGRRFGRSPKW